MAQRDIQIVLVFNQEDQAWARRTAVEVPNFWQGHSVVPVPGDVLRIGGRQFTLTARVWEHDGEGTVLRLFLGGSHAPSDTGFGEMPGD
jgi:hypothetical protein